MKWFHYLAAIVAGFLLGNAVPHFAAGVMGQAFPSPFADPPGVGLSSPLINTIWGLVNILIGYVLLRVGKVQPSNMGSMIAVFFGLAAVAILVSILFLETQWEIRVISVKWPLTKLQQRSASSRRFPVRMPRDFAPAACGLYRSILTRWPTAGM